jgi:hypothetical protein
MFRVLGNGDDKHRLEDASGTQVGWINGSAIGFRGFVTEDDARDAAVAARKALDAALARQYAGWPSWEPAPGRIGTVRDGVDEWFADGPVHVARLLRPQRRAYDSSYGIELILPSYANEGIAIAAACSVAAAVAPYRDTLAVPGDRETRRASPIEPEAAGRI